jgi:hypothetical protein
MHTRAYSRKKPYVNRKPLGCTAPHGDWRFGKHTNTRNKSSWRPRRIIVVPWPYRYPGRQPGLGRRGPCQSVRVGAHTWGTATGQPGRRPSLTPVPEPQRQRQRQAEPSPPGTRRVYVDTPARRAETTERNPIDRLTAARRLASSCLASRSPPSSPLLKTTPPSPHASSLAVRRCPPPLIPAPTSRCCVRARVPGRFPNSLARRVSIAAGVVLLDLIIFL